MKKLINKYIFSCFLCFCFVTGCRHHTSPFIPERHPSIHKNEYADYCEKLKEAYAKEDYYLVSFYQANLKSPKEVIYTNLKKAVTHDTSACIQVFEITYLAEQGFYRHLYRIDTNAFKTIFELCLLQKRSNSYELYKLKEIKKTRDYLNGRESLDSTLFDWNLIARLKEIDEDDQFLRKKMRSLNIAESERQRLFNLQIQKDSINLLRVDSILNTYGYPTKKTVGDDYAQVIVIVIHHQKDLSIRQKYLDRIRRHLSKEQIELIEKRTQEIIHND